MRRRLLVIVGTLAASIVFAAAPHAADKVIRIGAPLPLTGPLSPEAAKIKRGYDLWAETVNKQRAHG